MGKNDEKTRAIVAAAIEEFDQNGFAGANMDRIAQRATVSKRTVYNHFDGKETLFHAIWEEMVTMANASIDFTYDSTQPLRPQLLALGAAIGHLSCNREYMQVMRLGLGEFLREPVKLDKKTSTLRHDAICAAMFTDASRAGALQADDPAHAASQFLAMVKAGSFWPAVFSGTVADPATVDLAVDRSVDVIVKVYGTASEA
ncbi:MAG: TetR/AcrR family transcriptional regulator [Paracoccaceae bacterium]